MLAVRVHPDTKADLERVAKANGRSVSREVNSRLKRSFTKRDDAWGDDLSRGLGLVVARIVTAAQEATGKQWNQDRYVYEAVFACVNAVLRQPAMLPAPAPAIFPHDNIAKWAADPEIYREPVQLGLHLADWILRELFREATEPYGGEEINDDLPKAGRLLGIKPAWKEIRS